MIKNYLLTAHYFIVTLMSKLWIVNNLLIAKVVEDGEKYPCIYCTILRNAVLFFILGGGFGYFLGIN